MSIHCTGKKTETILEDLIEATFNIYEMERNAKYGIHER